MTMHSEPAAVPDPPENTIFDAVDTVLALPEIQALASTPDYHDSLRKCVEGIVRERHDADLNTQLRGTRKAFRATTDKLIIFISYKRAQHRDAARQLQLTLQSFGGSKVDVFLDETDIPYGEAWLLEIGEKLKEANCFILIVPHDAREREWPIFETGYFAGQMLPGERLVCLYHTNGSVPEQIRMYRGTEATKEKITELLKAILVTRDFIPGLDPINPASEERLASDAAAIAQLIKEPPRIVVKQLLNFMTLQLQTPGILTGMVDLLAAQVVAGQGLEELFSYEPEDESRFFNVSLSDVLMAEDNSIIRHEAWLKEITEVVRAVIDHRRPPIPFAKFAKADQTRFFRPLVRIVEEAEGVVTRFEVAFGEHLIPPVANPDALQVMEAAIRLAARFRTEIVRPFEFAQREDDVVRAMRLLDSIERDAADEGLRNKELVVGEFSGEQRNEVSAMYDIWGEFRNVARKGKLDIVFATKDPVGLRQCLKELRAINYRFLVLASERYAEMVKFVAS